MIKIDKEFELFIVDLATVIATTKDVKRLRTRVIDVVNIYRQNITQTTHESEHDTTHDLAYVFKYEDGWTGKPIVVYTDRDGNLLQRELKVNYNTVPHQYESYPKLDTFDSRFVPLGSRELSKKDAQHRFEVAQKYYA